MNHPCSNCRGFTLLELLVVMGIASVLLAIAVPAFHSTHEAANLRRSARSLVDQLNLARQTALTRNCQVEVRFIEAPAAAPMGGQFRAAGYVELRNEGKTQPGRTITLPGAVILSRDAEYQYSPLIGANLKSVAAADDPQLEAGKYAAFRFHPSGETTLRPLEGPSGDGWYLTLYSFSSAGKDSLPPNYITISIDALTGRARIFQP